MSLILLEFNSAFAQYSNAFVGVRADVGAILRIYPEFPKLGTYKSFAVEVGTSVNEPNWKNRFGEMQSSFQFAYCDLGNAEVLGKAYALTHKMLFLKNGNSTWSTGASLLLGGAYFTKPYHYLNNTENVAVGGKFGFWVGATYEVRKQLFDRWTATVGLQLLHSSNGHTALPNVGLNVPSMVVGLNYRLGEISRKSGGELFAKPENRLWNVRYAHGVFRLGETVRPTNGPLYHSNSFTVSSLRWTSAIARNYVGVEATYNLGYQKYFVIHESDLTERKKWNTLGVSIFVGKEFVYKHWGLLIQGGLSVFNPAYRFWMEQTAKQTFMNHLKQRLPGKFGVNYYFIQPTRQGKANTYCGVFVKSNLLQADYLEFCLGVQF